MTVARQGRRGSSVGGQMVTYAQFDPNLLQAGAVLSPDGLTISGSGNANRFTSYLNMQKTSGKWAVEFSTTDIPGGGASGISLNPITNNTIYQTNGHAFLNGREWSNGGIVASNVVWKPPASTPFLLLIDFDAGKILGVNTAGTGLYLAAVLTPSFTYTGVTSRIITANESTVLNSGQSDLFWDSLIPASWNKGLWDEA